MQWNFSRILKNEKGTSAIEYSLVAVLIGIAIIGTLFTLRTQVVGLYMAVVVALS